MFRRRKREPSPIIKAFDLDAADDLIAKSDEVIAKAHRFLQETKEDE